MSVASVFLNNFVSTSNDQLFATDSQRRLKYFGTVGPFSLSKFIIQHQLLFVNTIYQKI